MQREQASQTTITNGHVRDPCVTGVYQTFRNGDDIVRIEAVLHPVTGTFVVLWGDIKTCFPGLTRLQNKNIYVPFIRGPDAYRISPPGMEHQPGVIFDVIYSPSVPKFIKIRCNKPHKSESESDSISRVGPRSAIAVAKDSHFAKPTFPPAEIAVRPHVIRTSPASIESALLEETIKSIELAATSTGLFTSKTHSQLSPNLSNSGASINATSTAASIVDSESDSSEDFIPPSYQIKPSPKEIDPAVIKEFVNAANSSAAANRDLSSHLTDFTNILYKTNSRLRPRSDQFSRPDSSHCKDTVSSLSSVTSGAAKENSPITPQSSAIIENKDSLMSSTQDTTLKIAPNIGEESNSLTKNSLQNQKRKGRALKRNKELLAAEQDLTSLQLMSTLGTQQLIQRDNSSIDKPVIRPVLASTSNASVSYSSTKSNATLTIQKIATHRAKNIMAARYNWLESPCSRLFVILPRKDNIASVAEVDAMTWQDFDVHFLCDCMDIPGAGIDVNGLFKDSDRDGTGAIIPKSYISEDGVEHEPIRYTGHSYTPHLDLSESSSVSLQKECTALAPYLMTVLEMLEYGIVIDGVVKVRALQDLDERKKAMYSMYFLLKHGAELSHQLFSKGISSLDEIEPTAPLKPSELSDFYRNRISVKRPMNSTIPFRSPDGDVRWVCTTHWNQLTVWDFISQAFDFSKNLNSSQAAYHMNFGTFVATLKTRERAREFYKLAGNLKSTPVISFFLDWELTIEDERELELVPRQILASCLKIQVRERENRRDNSSLYPCFDHGYFKVVLEAVRNNKIQAFLMEKRAASDSTDLMDDLHSFKSSVSLDPILARFCREQTSNKIQLSLLVTDLDMAVSLVRKGLCGFHSLSQLTLESSYWDHLNIDFNTSGIITDEVEDAEYAKQSDIDFFNSRSSDAITVRTYFSAGTSFLRSNALKDINIRISLPEDGPRIREVIKNCRRLNQVELAIETKDDPCQVFEYFKALMADHPSLVSFQLRKDWGKNNKSNFVWHGVADRTTMTLAIQSYAEDKIGPLLQKFGSCLLQLYIHSINQQDSAILEKVTGSRRGLKLMAIMLADACALPQPVLDDLAKVVMRLNLQRFSIAGTVAIRSVNRLADFMKVVAGKITDIHLFGEHAKVILTELGKRMPATSGMAQLLELKISGPFDATTKDLVWMRSLFKKEIALNTIELHKVNLSHQGWMTLAQEIDFKRLRYFRVGPEASLKPEAIAAFTNNVPEDSELENFHLDTDGMKEVHCLSYKAALLPKLKKKTALVSIGRYF
ncbi:hypothetical protein FBU30_007718 [Linnemannia zychae]|nr:hypothetical protein FBU30_007718 [Linnemannia zychae]